MWSNQALTWFPSLQWGLSLLFLCMSVSKPRTEEMRKTFLFELHRSLLRLRLGSLNTSIHARNTGDVHPEHCPQFPAELHITVVSWLVTIPQRKNLQAANWTACQCAWTWLNCTKKWHAMNCATKVFFPSGARSMTREMWTIIETELPVERPSLQRDDPPVHIWRELMVSDAFSGCFAPH